MRSCGEGAVGAAGFVTSHWFGLVALASCKQGSKGGCEKNLFHKKQLFIVKYSLLFINFAAKIAIFSENVPTFKKKMYICPVF
jgi:hypothetical protein